MLEHRGRAMEKVRILLDQDELRIGGALIMAIVCLSTVEGALGNLKSYRLHFLHLSCWNKKGDT